MKGLALISKEKYKQYDTFFPMLQSQIINFNRILYDRRTQSNAL